MRIQRDTEELISLSDAKSKFLRTKCRVVTRSERKAMQKLHKEAERNGEKQAEKGKNRGELEWNEVGPRRPESLRKAGSMNPWVEGQKRILN